MDKLECNMVLIKQLDVVKNMVKSENSHLGKTVIDRAITVIDGHDRVVADNERLKAEIDKLKRIEQKAFWWSAEFTSIVHDNNIRSAWNDWCENKRKSVQ